MFDLFKNKTLPVTHAEKGLIHKPYETSHRENRDIERAFTRLFLSDDGQKVLSHLQCITFQRALGPSCSDEQLRYLEGQRSLVATILRLIDRGRKA